ncbi:MAG: chemotaxis protein CheW [Myxococcota bacterium]
MRDALLTFQVGGMHLGIPVDRVEEVLRRHVMTRVPLATAAIGGLMNLRGQIVLAVDLRYRLELGPRDGDRPPMHVVVRSHDALHSLLVDEIGDVLDLGGRVQERVPERIRDGVRALATGVYKLPERVILALDVDRIADPAAL